MELRLILIRCAAFDALKVILSANFILVASVVANEHLRCAISGVRDDQQARI